MNSDSLDNRLNALDKRVQMESHDIYVVGNRSDVSELRRECRDLYRDLKFDDGIARAKRDPGWERDPEANLYVGLGCAYKHAYAEARSWYERAAKLSQDQSFSATCIANAANTWFEEGAMDQADETYKRALTLDAVNPIGLLGRIAIACQRRDIEQVEKNVRTLIEKIPDWQHEPVVTEMIARDRSFRFLRQHTDLFTNMFGINPDEIVLQSSSTQG